MDLFAIYTIVTSVVTIASVIANITKTDADNKIVASVSKFVNIFALNFNVKK